MVEPMVIPRNVVTMLAISFCAARLMRSTTPDFAHQVAKHQHADERHVDAGAMMAQISVTIIGKDDPRRLGDLGREAVRHADHALAGASSAAA
jgi:hypothetical protein